MSKTLDLVLKHKWYDMIDIGKKPEEYREIKPYWIKRIMKSVKWCSKGVICCTSSDLGYRYCFDNLMTGRKLCYIKDGGVSCGNLKDLSKISNGYTHIRFHRGYTSNTMTFEIGNKSIGKGREDWGAEPNNEIFIIKLGKRL